MNKPKFDSLPANYQAILIESAHDAAKYQRDLNAKQVAEIIAGVKEAGVEVIDRSIPPRSGKSSMSRYAKPLLRSMGWIFSIDRGREVAAGACRGEWA